MGQTRDIETVINDIAMCGDINLGKCCNKTLKNWVNDINNSLEIQNLDWRVTGMMEQGAGSISAISKERYDAIKNAILN